MGAVFIYSLSCPETGRVRYVGKANKPRERLASHLRDSRHGTRPVCRWVNKLLARNLAPVMAILVETDEEHWEEEEVKQIALYRAQCSDLLNVAPGGNIPSQTKAQRATGGRTAAKSRVKTPRDAEIYRIKTEIGNGLKWMRKNSPDGYKRLADQIRPLTIAYPSFFGVWTGI